MPSRLSLLPDKHLSEASTMQALTINHGGNAVEVKMGDLAKVNNVMSFTPKAVKNPEVDTPATVVVK